MQFLLAFAFLLGVSSDKFGDIYQSIQDDIRALNASCAPRDSCRVPRISDSLEEFSCQCAAVCSLFGTCCADSQYNFAKPPKVKTACRRVNKTKAFFMVDRCAEGDDNTWKNLCEEDWNGDDDVRKLVPVTSIITRITYKNYFCFRCHETNEDYLYWNVTLGSSDYEFGQTIDRSRVSVSYDQTSWTWVAPLGKGGALVPVNLTFDVPNEIYPLPVTCRPELISQCAEGWDDDDVKEKCASYMGIVYISRENRLFPYRNAHCALCNFEDLGSMFCKMGGRAARAAGGGKKSLSFTHLLDTQSPLPFFINVNVDYSDGDKVKKVQRCEENSVWDPFTLRCRKLMCALPGYVVKGRKCVPQ